MQNNPVSYNDPVEDTVRGTNRKSAKRERTAIRNTFKGKEAKAMRKLFRLQGKTFAQIDKKKFLNAASGLSEDQRALAEGYMKLINSTKLHTVEVVNREEKLSSTVASALGLPAGTKGEVVDRNAGGGLNKSTSTGSLTVIVQNSTNGPADYMDQAAGKFVVRNSSVGELSAHELLGHALGNENRSTNAGHLDAIQMTNMYLRATGDGNFYRNGVWHGNNTVISPSNAAGSPSYVQETNTTVRQIISMLPVLINIIP